MNTEHVPSSPHFFRPVVRSLVAGLVVLLVAARFLPAPLQPAADPAHAPNPAKAAWFLLWIQEVVSHGTGWIYPVLALGVLFTLLPWLRRGELTHASWFQRGERWLALASGAVALAILLLTIVANFLRGEQWRFLWPS